MFFNILRRRRVTVVTTHTEFAVHGAAEQDGDHASDEENVLKFDFDQARRRTAPVLSALISGADYLFDLSAKPEGNKGRALEKQDVLLHYAAQLYRLRRKDADLSLGQSKAAFRRTNMRNALRMFDLPFLFKPRSL